LDQDVEDLLQQLKSMKNKNFNLLIACCQLGFFFEGGARVFVYELQ